MKRYITIPAILLLAMSASSQTYNFKPLVKENKQWVYYEGGYDDHVVTYYPVVYEIKGDTVIDGVSYKKLWEDYCHFDPIQKTVTRTIKVVAYLREETGAGKVYARRAGSHRPLTGVFNSEDSYGAEFLIYDFTGVEYFFKNEVMANGWQRTTLFDLNWYDMEEIEVGGETLRCWPTRFSGHKIIEGIGYVVSDDYDSTGAWVQNFVDLSLTRRGRAFSHVIEDGEIFFKSNVYDKIHKENIYDPDAVDPEVGVDDLPAPASPGDGVTYDMQGRRVNAPASPGLYIRDGHKILVP